MANRLGVVLLALLQTLAATPVAAQGQRIFVLHPDWPGPGHGRARARVSEIRSEAGRLGEVIRTFAIPNDVVYRPGARIVGAGRYLLLTSDDETVVLDTVTGAVIRAGVVDVIGVIGDGRELVTSSYTAAGQRLIEVITVATQARRRIDLPPACVFDVAVAEQARTLVVLRAEQCPLGEPPAQWVDIMSLDGAPTRPRVVDVPYGSAQRLVPNPEGTRLWVSTSHGTARMPEGVALFDLAAGRPLAQTIGVSPRWPSDTRFMPGHNVLLSVTTGGLTALDAESLGVLYTADAARNRLDGVPLPGGYQSHVGYTVMADDDAQAVFVYEYTGVAVNYGGGVCVQAALIAVDPDTGQRLAGRDARDPMTGEPLCGLQLAMAVAPPAPAGFGATLDGSRVTLTWQPSPGATHYEVEAGSSPGRRDLARYVTGDTSLTVPGVPPGTYYVRVRALNFAAKGRYTADVVVTIPGLR